MVKYDKYVKKQIFTDFLEIFQSESPACLI